MRAPPLPLLALLLAALCCGGCMAAGRPHPAQPLPSIKALAKGPFDCLGTNTSAACDAFASCSWCNSTKSVGTGCYPTQVAKILPEKYFSCDKFPPDATKPAVVVAAPAATVADAPTDCGNYTKAKACHKADGCTWCTANGMGTCYPDVAAKFLPKMIFKCDKKKDDEAAAEVAAKPSPFDCVGQKTAAACDDYSTCTWCTAGGGGLGTGCYPSNVAKILPDSFFKCDAAKAAPAATTAAATSAPPVIDCISQDKAKACDKTDGCTWCVTGTMGTCYPDAAAQLLPRALFKCDKKKEGKEEGSEGVPASTLSAAAVTAKPSPLDCVAQNTSAACDEYEACSWCTTSGLGTGCYPSKVAKILPGKFFTCDKFPKPAKEEATCEKRPEGECTAPDCAWCTSAAVGAACYTPEQAKRLPSAVFKCTPAA